LGKGIAPQTSLHWVVIIVTYEYERCSRMFYDELKCRLLKILKLSTIRAGVFVKIIVIKTFDVHK